MGTVHPIRDQGHMALGSAVEAFLVTLDHPESRGTRRVYASTLRALRAEFGDATDAGTLEPGQVAAWFTRQWGQGAPATWNRNLDAIRSLPGPARRRPWSPILASLRALPVSGLLRRPRSRSSLVAGFRVSASPWSLGPGLRASPVSGLGVALVSDSRRAVRLASLGVALVAGFRLPSPAAPVHRAYTTDPKR